MLPSLKASLARGPRQRGSRRQGPVCGDGTPVTVTACRLADLYSNRPMGSALTRPEETEGNHDQSIGRDGGLPPISPPDNAFNRPILNFMPNHH